MSLTEERSNPNNSFYLDPEYYIFDHSTVQITLFVLYSVVFFFCSFGNLTVVLVMTLHWKMRSVTKFCLSNLAIANLCVGVFCIYQNLTMFIINSWIFGETLCKMFHFITSLSTTGSILILVVIAIERYIVIVYPFQCRTMLTTRRLRLIIFGVWLASVVLCIPKYLHGMLITHKKVSRAGEENGEEIICSVSPSVFSSKEAEMVQFVLLFVIPLLIISVLYYKVGVTLHQREAFSEAFVATSIFDYELEYIPHLTGAEDHVGGRRSPCAHNGESIVNRGEENSRRKSEIIPGGKHEPRPRATCSNICENCQKHSNFHKRKANGCSHGANKSTHTLVNLLGKNCSYSKEMICETISPESIPCTSKLIRINFPGSAVCCEDCGFICCHTKISSTYRPHKDAVKLLVIIVVSFAACNAPYHARKIYQNYFYKPENESDWDELATPLSFLLMYTNCALNPIIYAFMSKNFRLCLWDLVKCRLKKTPREVKK